MSTTTPATAIPDEETVKAALKLEILNVEGKKVAFGSIVEGQKTIVVFIRHFFCGSCQMYVESLSTVANPALQKTGAKIVVVGCGEWNPIQSYAETTGFPSAQIYADPSRTLYRVLGMNIEKLDVTPKGQERKSYLTKSVFVNAVQSFWNGPIKNPTLIGKQGNISQLGGDFVFGPGQTCSFASRMQHTEDHLEIKDLLKAAGLDVGVS